MERHLHFLRGELVPKPRKALSLEFFICVLLAFAPRGLEALEL
jgi:hypothetical protein